MSEITDYTACANCGKRKGLHYLPKSGSATHFTSLLCDISPERGRRTFVPRRDAVPVAEAPRPEAPMYRVQIERPSTAEGHSRAWISVGDRFESAAEAHEWARVYGFDGARVVPWVRPGADWKKAAEEWKARAEREEQMKDDARAAIARERGMRAAFEESFHKQLTEKSQRPAPSGAPSSRPDLTPPESLLAIGRVLAKGLDASGNDPERWRALSTQEHLARAMVHVLDFLAGRLNDDVTGEPNLAHAACRVLYAIEKARMP